MNREKFVNHLNRILEGKTLEEKEKILNRISDLLEEVIDTWIPEYEELLTEGYSVCPNCGQYLLTDNFETTYETETRIEPTYIDSGYGDDDRHGKVEYSVIYSKCPVCDYKEEKGRIYSRTLWEKNRHE